MDVLDSLLDVMRPRGVVLGRSLQPDAFKSVCTVQDIVDVLYGLIRDQAA